MFLLRSFTEKNTNRFEQRDHKIYYVTINIEENLLYIIMITLKSE